MKRTCSICEKKINGFSNNPSPMPGEHCCEDCNNQIVVPLRVLATIDSVSNFAVLIEIGKVSFVKPEGKYFTLKELQSYVNGYIELAQPILKNCLTLVNEEGLIHGLPANSIVEKIFHQRLVGNVLIVPNAIFEKSEEGERK